MQWTDYLVSPLSNQTFFTQRQKRKKISTFKKNLGIWLTAVLILLIFLQFCLLKQFFHIFIVFIPCFGVVHNLFLLDIASFYHLFLGSCTFSPLLGDTPFGDTKFLLKFLIIFEPKPGGHHYAVYRFDHEFGNSILWWSMRKTINKSKWSPQKLR